LLLLRLRLLRVAALGVLPGVLLLRLLRIVLRVRVGAVLPGGSLLRVLPVSLLLLRRIRVLLRLLRVLLRRAVAVGLAARVAEAPAY